MLGQSQPGRQFLFPAGAILNFLGSLGPVSWDQARCDSCDSRPKVQRKVETVSSQPTLSNNVAVATIENRKNRRPDPSFQHIRVASSYSLPAQFCGSSLMLGQSHPNGTGFIYLNTNAPRSSNARVSSGSLSL